MENEQGILGVCFFVPFIWSMRFGSPVAGAKNAEPAVASMLLCKAFQLMSKGVRTPVFARRKCHRKSLAENTCTLRVKDLRERRVGWRGVQAARRGGQRSGQGEKGRNPSGDVWSWQLLGPSAQNFSGHPSQSGRAVTLAESGLGVTAALQVQEKGSPWRD